MNNQSWHNIPGPDEIDADFLEVITGDLCCALVNAIDNEGDPNEIEQAREILDNIAAMIDALEEFHADQDDLK